MSAGLSLLAAGKTHLAIEYLAKLLGAADGEGPARQRVDLPLKPHDLARIVARQPRQLLPVHLDAGALHLGDDGHQRPVDHLVDEGQALAREAGLQPPPEPQRPVWRWWT